MLNATLVYSGSTWTTIVNGAKTDRVTFRILEGGKLKVVTMYAFEARVVLIGILW